MMQKTPKNEDVIWINLSFSDGICRFVKLIKCN